MSRPDDAVSTFMNFGSCSRAVLSSFTDKTGLPVDLALRVADGFGAGMGRKQEVCGAVTGGIMVLGLLLSPGEHESREQRGAVYAKVREFMDAFAQVNGSVSCRQLLDGCDLLSDEGQKRFHDENMRGRCAEFVRTAVEILEKMEPGQRPGSSS